MGTLARRGLTPILVLLIVAPPHVCTCNDDHEPVPVTCLADPATEDDRHHHDDPDCPCFKPAQLQPTIVATGASPPPVPNVVFTLAILSDARPLNDNPATITRRTGDPPLYLTGSRPALLTPPPGADRSARARRVPVPTPDPEATVPSRAILTPIVVVALVAGLGAAAYLTRARWLPKEEDKPAAEPDHHDHEHPDRVKLSPQAQASLGLIVEPLIPEEYSRTVVIPGLVVDRPGVSDRAVTIPVAGVMTSLKVQPGDTVKPGEPLAVIRVVSELLQTAQTDLFKATRDVQIAADNLKLLRSAPAETIAGAKLIDAENTERRAGRPSRRFAINSNPSG